MRRQAERCLVFPASTCSCSLPQLGLAQTRASAVCAVCGGFGHFYRQSVPILATVSSYEVRRDPLEMMTGQPGDLTLGVLPRQKIWLRDFDLVRFPHFEDGEVFAGELIRRGATATDATRFIVKKVDFINQVKSADTLVDYVQGVDYTIQSGSKGITWLTGHGPLPGEAYFAKYRATFDWIVMQPPVARYARGTDIGQRVMLRRRDVINDVVAR